VSALKARKKIGFLRCARLRDDFDRGTIFFIRVTHPEHGSAAPSALRRFFPNT